MTNKTISELNPATLSNDLAMIVEGSTETQKTTVADLKAFVGADKQDKLTAGDNIIITDDNSIELLACYRGEYDENKAYKKGDICCGGNTCGICITDDPAGVYRFNDGNYWTWFNFIQQLNVFGNNREKLYLTGVNAIVDGTWGRQVMLYQVVGENSASINATTGELEVPGGIKDYQTTDEADAKYLTTASIEGKQDTSNLVTSLSAESTDTQYPSAKCVYDLLGDVETLLSQI